MKKQTRPATAEELAKFAYFRKVRKAVDLGTPQGLEPMLQDPAGKKRRPVYTLPRCPACNQTIRHKVRCKQVGVFSLKPTKRWETRDEIRGVVESYGEVQSRRRPSRKEDDSGAGDGEET